MLPELVVYYLMLFAGFTEPQAHTMTCVAKYESALNPKAVNLFNDNATIDVGLLQINTIWFESSYYCSIDRLRNPMYNVLCGKQVFDVQGLDAWYGYKKNKEKCDSYKVNLM